MLLSAIDLSLTKELIGIFTLAISGVTIIVRLNSRLDKLEFRTDNLEEDGKEDRDRTQRMFEKLQGDIVHLEKHIGQMQTNIRVFIGEQNNETNAKLEKLFTKIDEYYKDLNDHKLEVAKQVSRNGSAK